MKTQSLILIALLLALAPNSGVAEGHGPSFALATPTLGTGGWSSDTVFMRSTSDRGSISAFGQMLGYGIKQDLQLNLKIPLAIDRTGLTPNARAGMMGAPGDAEAQLLWRFHRRAPAVGTRRESTLHVGIGAPTRSRRGFRPGITLNAAVAAGYASRDHYWWLAGGYQRSLTRDESRPGDLVYATAAYGYRPAYFRLNDTAVDLRWFAEAVIESAGKDIRSGRQRAQTGGTRLLAGPTFLALSGRWGLSGGILLPLDERLRDDEAEEDFRAKLIVTYWF